MTEKEEIENLGDFDVWFRVDDGVLELCAFTPLGKRLYYHRFADLSGESVGEELDYADAIRRGYEQAIEDVVEIMEDEG